MQTFLSTDKRIRVTALIETEADRITVVIYGQQAVQIWTVVDVSLFFFALAQQQMLAKESHFNDLDFTLQSLTFSWLIKWL